MPKLGPEYRNQSLSCGTMLSDDVFAAIKRFLPAALVDQYEHELDLEARDSLLNGEIWDYMDDIAPEGCSFSSHPGDGADFGFWEEDE
ncbi:hypothetical protein CEB3_c19480 [Peptococcaceae bacterium CEB3]|nr:hypothetical protein CEB3_c19480 [Peptococcaceae bacterium CEB3]